MHKKIVFRAFLAHCLTICLPLLACSGALAADYVELARLAAADGAPGDMFGRSVAVSGDTVVVGATDAADKGLAYIFVKPAEGWPEEPAPVALLAASDGAADDYFGVSVAIEGDTVAVGAFAVDFDVIFTNRGAVYVFEKPSGGWDNMTETARLTASDTSAIYFGKSVALSGDTIAVGAPGADIGISTGQGAAFVFVKPGDSWDTMTQTAKLTASDGAEYDNLGQSVSIHGDTVVAGSANDDVGMNADQGSVSVFEKPGSGWADMTETAMLTASDGAAGDWFGNSAAISGDTVVVGAPYHDGGMSNRGAAYVFEKPLSGWDNMTESAKLAASDGVANHNLGGAAAISGDTAIVSAMGLIGSPGAAYVFEKPSAGWDNMTESAKLAASDAEANDYFGIAVAISGATAVVGATGKNMSQGAAYVFATTSSTTTTAPCVDSDGDGYGQNCAPGPDCDDTDAFYTDTCPDCAVRVFPGTFGRLSGDRNTTRLLLVVGERGTDFGASPTVSWDSGAIETLSRRVLFNLLLFMRVKFSGGSLDEGLYRVLVNDCQGEITWAE
jgi:hypothetical protein